MSSDSLGVLKPYLSLFHPIAMGILAIVALYALYLGVQVRRTRLANGDLKKELLKGRFAIRHHQIGAILLALMVIGSVGGMLVTYLNNGKIVIGPHLFAGLGMMGAIAASAALVPFMQKHDWVRNLHVVFNVVLLGLFGWQTITGLQIVQKILEL